MGPGSQAGEMIFLTSKEKAVIRRYAIVCQLWREGDQDFLGLEYDLAAGCSILAGRIAIDTRSRHIIGSDAGDRAFHAAIFYNDRGAVPEIAAKDLRRLRRYIIRRKGVLPVRNPVRVRGERRRWGIAGFCRKLLVKLGVRRRARRHLRGLQ
jgi:hypothetical protein